jgi:hypothetical protein
MRASYCAQICLLRMSRAMLDVPLGGSMTGGNALAHVSCAAAVCLLSVSRAILDVPL